MIKIDNKIKNFDFHLFKGGKDFDTYQPWFQDMFIGIGQKLALNHFIRQFTK